MKVAAQASRNSAVPIAQRTQASPSASVALRKENSAASARQQQLRTLLAGSPRQLAQRKKKEGLLPAKAPSQRNAVAQLQHLEIARWGGAVPAAATVDARIAQVIAEFLDRQQPDAIPPHFEVLAVGSYGREELTAESDLDLTVLVEAVGEGVPAFLQALISHLKATVDNSIEAEGLATPQTLVNLDTGRSIQGRGQGVQRTFRGIYEHNPAGSEVNLTEALRAGLEAGQQSLRGVWAENAGHLAEQLTGTIEVKTVLYKPLYMLVNMLFMQHCPGNPTANTLARLQVLRNTPGVPAYIDELEGAFQSVLAIRNAGGTITDRNLRRNYAGLRNFILKLPRIETAGTLTLAQALPQQNGGCCVIM